MTNFNDLPCNIKQMIFNINKEAAKDMAFKRNYTEFVNNFKHRAEGECWFYQRRVCSRIKLIENEYGFWISPSGNVHDWGRGIVNSQDFDATSDDDN